MTIDKEKLKALAERAIANNPPGGDGNPYPALGVPAVDVLALLAEIEQDEMHLRAFRDAAESVIAERDKLKAENEALRKLKLPDYLKLSDEMRAAGDHAEQRAREDQCYSVPALKAVFFEAAIQRWLDDQEEAIDAAMAKEASHG